MIPSITMNSLPSILTNHNIYEKHAVFTANKFNDKNKQSFFLQHFITLKTSIAGYRELPKPDFLPECGVELESFVECCRGNRQHMGSSCRESLLSYDGCVARLNSPFSSLDVSLGVVIVVLLLPLLYFLKLSKKNKV